MSEQFSESVEITNVNNDVTIKLEGNTGNLLVGGNGQNGDISIRNRSSQQTIRLDGEKGQVFIKDWAISVPDFVFEKDYQLYDLDELRAYMKQHKHLPEVPSAQQIEEQGLNLSQFSMLLLKKVEELLLYIFQQHKTLCEQETRLARLERSAN